MFLTCTSLASLWLLVRAWIGFDGVDTQVIYDHFTQFTYYTCGLKARCSFLNSILGYSRIRKVLAINYQTNAEKILDHNKVKRAKPLLVHTNGAPLVPDASQAFRELGFLKTCNQDFSTRVQFIELLVCSASRKSLLGFRNLTYISLLIVLLRVIPYVDEDFPFEDRQASLADYGFRCKCPKCIEEEP
ncbi:hypothetical protein MTR_2g088740 [Medicago truncatula]|uniref:Transmembrane protein n=1 Tax=Medicago truncatula TaxID=3880 RepID=G7IKK1_MEDTR|nr:hypothetical protein MTR_2g088740 [Medicago truncatula]